MLHRLSELKPSCKKLVFHNKKFAILIRVFFVVLVLAVLYFSAIFALDPGENSRLETDSLNKDLSSELVNAIDNYNNKTQEFPWEGDSLNWIRSDEIKLDELKKGEFLNSSYKATDEIFVGKGKNTEKVWACFAPSSKHERADIIKLRSLTPGAEVPSGDTPEYCEASPDWENSFCFVCVSQ